MVKGRIKYQTSENTIDLGHSAQKFIYRVDRNMERFDIKVGDEFVECASKLSEGQIDDFQPASISNSFTVNLLKAGMFVKTHWYKGLFFGKLALDILEELDIMAIPFTKSYRP